MSGHTPHHPTSLSELELAERLVVWSFRRWVSGTENWALVEREFRRQFADTAAQGALRSFAMFVEALRCHARRVIRYHQPGCPCLGSDEVCVLTLVTATQAGDMNLATATGRWLVRPEGLDRLVEAAAALGRAMACQDLLLPRRLGDDVRPVRPAVPFDGTITIH
ncbi:hypothetical protein GCM10011611_45060 [Aliidongia dinghuensis]|uniref:Uncharacterized protein n=1 Tax=Aliidongia dinghuensis TaxID=1867774 RepID=A0A8J2YYK8_9PROT|nr:hypothetical protein [Aliidongia dinghuensis]GGF33817.1 hypothetical protein GCM10011611_45060 [Aliidongia dinghuensis]